MEIKTNTNSQNFNGKVYIINKLSKKPARCILKEQSNLTRLIKNEKFDLFIKQDYSKNIVNITASTKSTSDINAANGVPITAKPGAYTIAAIKSAKEYKALQDDIFEKAYKQKQTLKEKFYNAVEKFLNEYCDD